jgi:hypothetical protein
MMRFQELRRDEAVCGHDQAVLRDLAKISAEDGADCEPAVAEYLTSSVILTLLDFLLGL